MGLSQDFDLFKLPKVTNLGSVGGFRGGGARLHALAYGFCTLSGLSPGRLNSRSGASPVFIDGGR